MNETNEIKQQSRDWKRQLHLQKRREQRRSQGQQYSYNRMEMDDKLFKPSVSSK